MSSNQYNQPKNLTTQQADRGLLYISIDDIYDIFCHWFTPFYKTILTSFKSGQRKS